MSTTTEGLYDPRFEHGAVRVSLSCRGSSVVRTTNWSISPSRPWRIWPIAAPSERTPILVTVPGS